MGARVSFIVAAFLLSIGLLVGCGGSATGPKDWDDHTLGLPFEVGYDQGMKAAAAQDKPAMMFVTTTWCGWCKKLADENFNNEEVKELLTHFVCVIVDGDVETGAAQKLGADGYPHIVFLPPQRRDPGGILGIRHGRRIQTRGAEGATESSRSELTAPWWGRGLRVFQVSRFSHECRPTAMDGGLLSDICSSQPDYSRKLTAWPSVSGESPNFPNLTLSTLRK